MKKRVLIYVLFFALLLACFWFFLFKDYDFSTSRLAVLNDQVQDFSFANQYGDTLTERDIEDKVYLVEYFFTTCKGICPKMNANMRRVHDVYKDESDFLILSHTCMPETDSVPLLKSYAQLMLNGNLKKNKDGSYIIEAATNDNIISSSQKNNWFFVTGDKEKLYKMARQSYLIDNDKPDSTQQISDQFIHTQFFALLDKQRRVRGVYDGLKEDEIQKLIVDIKGLLKEKITTKRFMDGFNNNPG